MVDTQIAAVQLTAVPPAQRLVVALVAAHAARAGAIRELTLEDVDLAGRHITLAGHPQRLCEFVHGELREWLQWSAIGQADRTGRDTLVSGRNTVGSL